MGVVFGGVVMVFVGEVCGGGVGGMCVMIVMV